MAYALTAVGFASGVDCPHSGQWLETFDHEAYGGQGYGTFTNDITKAKRFATASEALKFWGRQSTVRPLRPDGLPNKPLTALTVAIDPIP